MYAASTKNAEVLRGAGSKDPTKVLYWDNPMPRRWLIESVSGSLINSLSSLLRISCNLFVIVHQFLSSSLSLLDRLVILVASLCLTDQAFIHLPRGWLHGVDHGSAVVGETAGETS